MSISQKSNLASTTRQQINKHDQQTTRSANIISKGFPLPHHPIRALHCRVRVPTANRRPIYSPLRLRIKDWLPGCLFSVRPTSHRARMGKTACGVSPTGTDAANPSAAPAQTCKAVSRMAKPRAESHPKALTQLRPGYALLCTESHPQALPQQQGGPTYRRPSLRPFSAQLADHNSPACRPAQERSWSPIFCERFAFCLRNQSCPSRPRRV